MVQAPALMVEEEEPGHRIWRRQEETNVIGGPERAIDILEILDAVKRRHAHPVGDRHRLNRAGIDATRDRVLVPQPRDPLRNPWGLVAILDEVHGGVAATAVRDRELAI